MKFNNKRKLSEANIQAEFYRACKLNNINVCLEYKHENCRFDAIIYDNNNNIRFIVEIKNYTNPNNARNKWNNTKQGKKYSNLNTPVILICSLSEIIGAVKHIKIELINKPNL